MKLKEAAKKVGNDIEETFTYCDSPSEHWTRMHTNNVIERLNREIQRRTRGRLFSGWQFSLDAGLCPTAPCGGAQWGNKKYMNIKRLETALEDGSIAD